jgi:hypothetical protein
MPHTGNRVIVDITTSDCIGEKYAGISVAYLQLLGNGAAVAIVPIMELLRGVRGEYILPLVFIAVLLVIAIAMAIRIRETGEAG